MERKRLLTTSYRDYYFRRTLKRGNGSYQSTHWYAWLWDIYSEVENCLRCWTGLVILKLTDSPWSLKRPLPKHCMGPLTFSQLSCTLCGHCQRNARVLKPSVPSDSCEPCGHCQSIAGVLKPSIPSDSYKSCGHCLSTVGVIKSSVPSDSCKPCGHCQSFAKTLDVL